MNRLTKNLSVSFITLVMSGVLDNLEVAAQWCVPLKIAFVSAIFSWPLGMRS